MYTLSFAPQALEDLAKLKKSEPAAFKKAGKLLAELQEHPKTGTGKPEALGGDRSGQWSRRISQKHRLIYELKIPTILYLWPGFLRKGATVRGLVEPAARSSSLLLYRRI